MHSEHSRKRVRVAAGVKDDLGFLALSQRQTLLTKGMGEGLAVIGTRPSSGRKLCNLGL
jgi:hypothetical protein